MNKVFSYSLSYIKLESYILFIVNIRVCFSNECVIEKAKLKKWGLLSFSKKPKSTMNLQKGNEGAALTHEGINQVKRLVEYLSKEQCKF